MNLKSNLLKIGTLTGSAQDVIQLFQEVVQSVGGVLEEVCGKLEIYNFNRTLLAKYFTKWSLTMNHI